MSGELRLGKRVLTAGVFDIVHLGHIYLLRKAKELAGKDGELIVVVSRDSTVEAREGRPPVIPEEERLAIVEALKPVDRAVLGYEPPSIHRILEEYKPDIVVFGYDQDKVKEEVEKAVSQLGLKVELVKLDKLERGRITSSSKIRKRLRRFWNERDSS